MSTDKTRAETREAPKGLLPLDELTTPGELVRKCLTEGDPMATREVPALALALLGASMAEGHKIADSLMEHYKDEADKWKKRALQAEQGIRDVQTLHQLLCNPVYARQLLKMVDRSLQLDPPPKDEFDDEDEGVW
jgi:hypothetical protein